MVRLSAQSKADSPVDAEPHPSRALGGLEPLQDVEERHGRARAFDRLSYGRHGEGLVQGPWLGHFWSGDEGVVWRLSTVTRSGVDEPGSLHMW